MSVLLGSYTRRTRRVAIAGHPPLTVTYERPDADTRAAAHVRALTEELVAGAVAYLSCQSPDIRPQLTVECGERPLRGRVELLLLATLGGKDVSPRVCRLRMIWDEEGGRQYTPFGGFCGFLSSLWQRSEKKGEKNRVNTLEKTSVV